MLRVARVFELGSAGEFLNSFLVALLWRAQGLLQASGAGSQGVFFSHSSVLVTGALFAEGEANLRFGTKSCRGKAAESCPRDGERPFFSGFGILPG